MSGCVQHEVLWPGGECPVAASWSGCSSGPSRGESGVWQGCVPRPMSHSRSFQVGQRAGPEPMEERGAACAGKRAKCSRAGSGVVARADGRIECGARRWA